MTRMTEMTYTEWDDRDGQGDWDDQDDQYDWDNKYDWGDQG